MISPSAYFERKSRAAASYIACSMCKGEVTATTAVVSRELCLHASPLKALARASPKSTRRSQIVSNIVPVIVR